MGGNSKTVAVSIAGSICVIMSWVVKEKLHIDIPTDVTAAFQTLISICVVFFVPHSNADGTTN